MRSLAGRNNNFHLVHKLHINPGFAFNIDTNLFDLLPSGKTLCDVMMK